MGGQYDGRGFRWPVGGADGRADAPSAWDYARDAEAGYLKAAATIVFMAVWLAAAIAWPDSGIIATMLIALLLVAVGTVTWVLPPIVWALSVLLAWLVGRTLPVEERRRRIEARRAEFRAHLLDESPGPPASKKSGDGAVPLAFLAGLLLGWFWGEDD